MQRDCRRVTIDWGAVLVRPISEKKGWTTQEIAEQIGLQQGTAQKYVRELARAGKLRFVGRRQVTRMDGITTWVPEYELTEGK